MSKIISILICGMLLFSNSVVSKESDIPVQEKIFQTARFISNYFTYGSGASLDSGLETIFENGIGNCTQTAYTMSRYIESLGLQTRMVGLFAKDGSNHILSETIIEGNWMLIDASNGVYYPHSATEILNDVSLLNDMIGTPNDFNKKYTSEEFWRDIVQLNFHNVYDFESSLPVTLKSSSSNFIGPDNTAEVVINNPMNSGYAATRFSDVPEDSWIEIDLQKDRFIHRVTIDWYSGTDYATGFELYGSSDGQEYYKIYSQDETTSRIGGFSTTSIPVNMQFRYIKFQSQTYHGQQRLLIRSIKAFSDPFEWDKLLSN